MDHFEEVSEWLGSSSSTPKHANLSLIDHPASISNVETPSFTSLIAEPVTEPFTLNTAEFLISNSDAETKTCENRVLLNLRHESSGIKIESNWSSSSSTSSQHLTVNTSEDINLSLRRSKGKILFFYPNEIKPLHCREIRKKIPLLMSLLQ
jgi:hypothetical protein